MLSEEVRIIVIEALKKAGCFNCDYDNGDAFVIYADSEDTEEYVKITIEEWN